MRISPMRTWPLVPLAAAIALAGCGDILPKPLPPPALYRLTAAGNFPAGASLATQLQIDVPLADAALDSTRIALSRSATTLDYFADSAWTDRLPLLLQTRLLESFQNAHRLIAVAGGTGGAAHGDVILLANLSHFEAQYGAAGPPQWRIALNADLVSAADRKVIASRIFTGSMTAAANNMTAIVNSADQAWRKVAAQIVDWSADTLARRPVR